MMRRSVLGLITASAFGGLTVLAQVQSDGGRAGKVPTRPRQMPLIVNGDVVRALSIVVADMDGWAAPIPPSSELQRPTAKLENRKFEIRVIEGAFIITATIDEPVEGGGVRYTISRTRYEIITREIFK